jgi:SAM-dependent methyltransferase
MTPDRTLYNSARMASGYAYARPVVHPLILERVRGKLAPQAVVNRGLDLGCGAGRSTAALAGFARQVVGLDPAAGMMEHRRVVAPDAAFVVGCAETLPLVDHAFDLITAAGAINYVDRDRALPEIARVLVADGTLVLYDFSAGRRLSAGGRLAEWYGEFERRYPGTPGYALDVRRLPLDAAGLTLRWYEDFEVSVPMNLDSYLRYVLTETRVELARQAGQDETAIREWCRLTLEHVFDDEPRDVVFEAYAAGIGKRASTSTA